MVPWSSGGGHMASVSARGGVDRGGGGSLSWEFLDQITGSEDSMVLRGSGFSVAWNPDEYHPVFYPHLNAWAWTDRSTGIRPQDNDLIGDELPPGWHAAGNTAVWDGHVGGHGQPIQSFAPTFVQPFDPDLFQQIQTRFGPEPTIVEAPVTTPDDFYGFEPTVSNVGLFPVQPPSGSNGFSPAGGALVVSASVLATRLTPGVLRQFMQWVVGRTTGAVAAWGSLPGWLRLGMGLVGFTGYDLLLDGDMAGLPSLPGFGGGAGGEVPRVGESWNGMVVLKTWTANGIPFWKTEGANGGRPRHWVRKLDGSIHSWVPQRPVVLMPGGAKNMRDLLRADDIIDRQFKKVKKAIQRRNPPSRKPKGPQQVVVVDAQHAALH